MNTAAFSAQLGSQQFMQLLVAQVQHQDPLEPIANQDFLAQLAQFSSLESLQNLNEQFADLGSSQQFTQSMDLLGHLASYGSTGQQRGIVEQLRRSDSGAEARVNNQWIPVSDIHSVALNG